ncbi:hypothetical protein ACFONG_15995 [Uliginosibacterium paludis]|uniref:Uncharacterized protein n=1 Tax=Uliginosibacterium paludis TaxID=1615952 RepID=A0ABV2CUI8_9RHOO
MDLKVASRLRPVTEAGTSVGRIYLYPLQEKDLNNFEKLPPADVIKQVRNLLTSIGSLTLESEEAPDRIPLDPEITTTLSQEEVEQLAEAYVKSSEWQTALKDSQERTPVAREAGEKASAYLIRLVEDEVQQLGQKTKQRHEKMLGSSRGIFDQVQKSTDALGVTLSEFEKLTKSHGVTAAGSYSASKDDLSEVNSLMADLAWTRGEERAEELELHRLTGQMTADSAKALKDLVAAATKMMGDMDARDIRNDKSTRRQIIIAVWSVGISAVFALVALIFSVLSYFQDRNNNTTDDQWQTKVLTVIEQVSQQHSALQRETQALQAQVELQGARITELRAIQRATAKSIGTSRPLSKPE